MPVSEPRERPPAPRSPDQCRPRRAPNVAAISTTTATPATRPLVMARPSLLATEPATIPAIAPRTYDDHHDPQDPQRHRARRLVLDAVGLVGVGAELLVPQRLVLGEVALEPAHLAVALEREDVGGDPVEEPPVVADDDRAPGERLEARPRARAGCRRRGRWWARRAAARCRRVFSTLARCTRLRSPPERSPTRFCWSEPLKLNDAT